MSASGVKRMPPSSICDYMPSSIPQPEQPPRILPTDLHPIVLADRAGIEPHRGVVDVLERPVGRKHDAVGADFQHGVVERLRVEIARRGDVEIFAEVIAESLPCRPAVPVLDPGFGMSTHHIAVRPLVERPTPALLSGGAGERPDNSIRGHWPPIILRDSE